MEVAYKNGIAPLIEEKISETEAFERTTEPFKKFMLSNLREADLSFFLTLSNKKVEMLDDTPLMVVVPAFILSELRRAFEIGFLLFIPFIVIDLLVASILMSPSGM